MSPAHKHRMDVCGNDGVGKKAGCLPCGGLMKTVFLHLNAAERKSSRAVPVTLMRMHEYLLIIPQRYRNLAESLVLTSTVD